MKAIFFTCKHLNHIFCFPSKKTNLKVAIPSNGCRGKYVFFLTPNDMFCISGHDIGVEGTSGRYLQAQNVFGHITHMWSTRVDQSG
eukprot:UN25234